MFLAVLVFAVAVEWISAVNEAATFNRITGSHVTAWDALWVELRVQSPAQIDTAGHK
jgi:hypothetical protein